MCRLEEWPDAVNRSFAKRFGVSQPYVAKLESGRTKNLGVRTLLKCAPALGGRVTLRIEPRPEAKASRSRGHRRAA